jgi:hypothetical protein
MRILVAGRFAAVAEQGGATWAVLQYVHGLSRLGHQVLLVEPAAPEPALVAYFRRVVSGQGLAGRAALVHGGRRATGLAYRDLTGWSASADVLLNLGGVLDDPELTEPVPLRVYLDLDPAFTQLWQLGEGVDMHLAGHHRFVSVGQAVGLEHCPVPALGRSWIPTVPPVVLDEWPAATRPPRYGITTVGNWRSYGPIAYRGVHYGQRAHSMRALVDLPGRVRGAAFEPALAIDRGEHHDLAALRAHGWRLIEPGMVARGPSSYRQFVQASTAELCVAKSGYVRSRCGWFSDRSACYLASGRPVVAQNTGWTDFVPEGEGLLAFTGPADAATALSEVVGNYRRHSKAARRLAEEVFDARLVLARLLHAVGAAA